MAKCTTTTCSIDGKVNPIPPSGSVRVPGDDGQTCGTCQRRHALCKCRRRVDRSGRGFRSHGTAPDDSSSVPTKLPEPTPSVVVPSSATPQATKLPARVPTPQRMPELTTGTITGVSRPADVLRPANSSTPYRPSTTAYTPPPSPIKPAPEPPPFLNLPGPDAPPSSTVATPRINTVSSIPMVLPTPAPAPPPSRPPYCGDPRFSATELCVARQDGSMPPPLSDYCQRRLMELGSVANLRLDELCSGSVPPARGAPAATSAKASTVAPGGAPIDDLINCATAFLSLPTHDQARVIEDGRLGAYAFSQTVASDLHTGVASAANVWVDWLGRNFPSRSPEVLEFCEAVRGAAADYSAPAGAVSAVVMGDAPYSMQFASSRGRDGTLRAIPGSRSVMSAVPDLFAYQGTPWDATPLERCVASLRAVEPTALGAAVSRVTDLRSNDWLARMGEAMGRGDAIDPVTGAVSNAEAMRDALVSYLVNWHNRGGGTTTERAIRDLCAAAYGSSYAAAGEPDAAAVIDDRTARDLFVRLPPSAQSEVIRGIAFKGQPYAQSLAVALDRGLYTVDTYPVPWLLFAWMDNEFAPGSAQRTLFNYDTSLAARANGLLTGPAGDPPTTPAAPGAQGAAQMTGTPPPGFTPAQWQQLVATSPEVAARLLTEFQQRPSTFAQVSQTILQAADRVLQGIHQGAMDDLAAQRAQAEHRQAMAQIELQRQQALAQRAQATMGVDPNTGLSTTTPAPTPMPYVQQPAPPPAPAPAPDSNTGTSTVTYVAVGGLALALLGGAYVISGAGRHKHNGWRRAYARAA